MFLTLQQIWRYWRSATRGASSWFGCRAAITTAQWQVNKCWRRGCTLADCVPNTGCCTTDVATHGQPVGSTCAPQSQDLSENGTKKRGFASRGQQLCGGERFVDVSGQTGRRPAERQQELKNSYWLEPGPYRIASLTLCRAAGEFAMRWPCNWVDVRYYFTPLNPIQSTWHTQFSTAIMKLLFKSQSSNGRVMQRDNCGKIGYYITLFRQIQFF